VHVRARALGAGHLRALGAGHLRASAFFARAARVTSVSRMLVPEQARRRCVVDEHARGCRWTRTHADGHRDSFTHRRARACSFTRFFPRPLLQSPSLSALQFFLSLPLHFFEGAPRRHLVRGSRLECMHGAALVFGARQAECPWPDRLRISYKYSALFWTDVTGVPSGSSSCKNVRNGESRPALSGEPRVRSRASACLPFLILARDDK